MKERIAKNINILSKFLGMRDVPSLTKQAFQQKYGIEQADLMVLFGGSILKGADVLAQAIQNNAARKYIIVGGAGHTTETLRRIVPDLMVLFGGSILKGADVLAQAIQNNAARKYIIVGGAGHTTETLRRIVHENYPGIETAGQSEAQIFQEVLESVHHVKADYLECQSTNCGNNITCLLNLIRKNNLPFDSIILVQDAVLESVHHVKADYLECQSTNCGNNITCLLNLIRKNNLPFDSIILVQDAAMQRRMDAGLRKYVSDPLIINYAAYQVDVSVDNDQLVYTENIPGMWQMDRFITLLMGEIPRLSDDAQGYGPNGQGFIAHVEIPEDVSKAFEELKEAGISIVRTANPAFASTNSL